eukprot:CAMPEP_0181472746 /NCGR_PEP_ID=MMETSP1110-20121109/39766_1 /TAXON_ID=174948 /ORGANISM="Symbiodinium sp., Strain CCMP421" /LENGTH=320 /DNA_ID=CAMNT_0023597839 /DNA_START=121 /DNA_END=1083 /DNA_ORIENTATION=+
MNVDDMAAIAFLLERKANIQAITVSTTGFSAQWAGVENALRLLHRYNRSDIPVAFQEGFVGQTQLNLKYPVGIPPPHWTDGSNKYFTDWISLKKSPKQAAWQSAAQLIVEVLSNSAEKVHFLELGPFTNLAAALHRDADAVRQIHTIYMEGGRLSPGSGSLRRLRGPGFPWTTATKPKNASWNVFVDAISASQVFAFGIPTMVVADNACDALVVDPGDSHEYGNANCTSFLTEIVLKWAPAHHEQWSNLKYWDPAVSVMMLQTLNQESLACQEWLESNLTVSLQNDDTYATFVQGQVGAPTNACLASNRASLLQTFYAGC